MLRNERALLSSYPLFVTLDGYTIQNSDVLIVLKVSMADAEIPVSLARILFTSRQSRQWLRTCNFFHVCPFVTILLTSRCLALTQLCSSFCGVNE